MNYCLLTIELITLSSLTVSATIETDCKALKSLINNIKLEQFTHDAELFFASTIGNNYANQAIYQQLAQELLDHARMVHAAKHDAVKQLDGKLIHDKGALIPLGVLISFAIVCGLDIASGLKRITEFKTFSEYWSNPTFNRPGPTWIPEQQALHPDLNWTWWWHYDVFKTGSYAQIYFSQYFFGITVAPVILEICLWGAHHYYKRAFKQKKILQEQINKLDMMIELLLQIQQTIKLTETNAQGIV